MSASPTASDELCDCSLEAVAGLIRNRDVSPVEVTRAVQARIERLDRTLNAFITVLGERALQQARAAESDILAGRYLGPLHGVPVSVKDIFDTAGIPTTAASRVLANHVPDRNAAVIDRLSDAGAVLIGKNNLLEFAYGNVHPDFGPSLNPWNTGYSAGGSSSGSAVAVAAGMGFGSIGTDTGGSIRIPASFCGVVGLKPIYDRVSRDGLIPLSWTTDHVGPITRTAADAAILFAAIAGEPVPAGNWHLDPPRDSRPLAGLRMGIDEAYLRPHVEPAVLALVEQAVRTMVDLGATVVEVELPSPDDVIAALFTIRVPEGTVSHQRWRDDRADDYSPAVRQRIASGHAVTAVQYLEAMRAREHLTHSFVEAFRLIDVLLTPTVPFPTYGARARSDSRRGGRQPHRRDHPLHRAVQSDGVSGDHAALRLRRTRVAGRTPEFAAAPDGEASLFWAALAYEQATPWHDARPGIIGESIVT